MSHLRAEVRNPAAACGHLTTAVFGSPRRGFEFTDPAPPAGFVPLDKARSFRDPPPPGIGPFTLAPFWEQRLEGRAALGHAPWENHQPGRAEHGTWYRMDEPPILADGTLDPLALIVMAGTMPGAVGEKLGPRHRHGWLAPGADLTFHLPGPCRPEWVFAHNLARHAGQGYASAEMALWDFGPDGNEEGRLVAYATQVCFFSFSVGPA